MAITEALEARPELKVYGSGAVINRFEARPSQVIAVEDGDSFMVSEFRIDVYGKQHALVHADIPRVANVGYLIDQRLYHPGDAYHVPPVPVEVLLLPTSGPWTKAGEAVDYVRAVNPKLLIQIHEILLSENGQQSLVRILGPSVLNVISLTILAIGDSITI